MKPSFYFVDRVFQVFGLLALPSAVWAAEVQKSEAAAVTILLGSIGIFFFGWVFTKIG